MNIFDICSFSEIDTLEESVDMEEYYVDELVTNPGLDNDRIIIYGPLYRLCGSELIVAEGVYFLFNEDSGELEPDFGVSLLYKSEGAPDLDSPLYWEQGTPACMLHNYIYMNGLENEPVKLLTSNRAEGDDVAFAKSITITGVANILSEIA